MNELLPIGQFSRRCGLTVTTLRHYHEVGLLVPAEVDGDNGYRRYLPSQIERARAIGRLRDLELSPDEIGAVLAGDRDLLLRRRAEIEARIWRLQGIHHRIRHLLEGKDDPMTPPDTTVVETSDHRRLGVELFNHVWTLLEKGDRSGEEDEEMVNASHASAYYWSRAPECRPENRARSHWQLSRVYSVLGRSEPALHHARRCLLICEEHELRDFDLGFAHEALARASRVAGDEESARSHVELALAVPIEEADNRELLEQDLATV
ncbi:MAG TPA: helix-turn-helix domain-containing protein [Gaiellaceae bacterium]|nr:helix-turn-helix domain-containing protein [Gaiellaceae bacterium]